MRVGRLTRAHGLKGALKVELYTDDPGRRFVPGAKFALQVPTSSKWHGESIELLELRVYNGNPVAFFAGITDRSEAETLVKAVLWVEQDPRELPEEPDAWYVHQLAGLEVWRDGAKIGRIVRIDPLPAQDLLIVEFEGREVMVPFVRAFVPKVDLAGGRVVITPPHGLFEEIDEETANSGESGAVHLDEPAAEAASVVVDDGFPVSKE